MLALREAAKKLGGWRLLGCNLYAVSYTHLRFSETLTMNYKLYVGREDNKDTFELAVELAEGLAIDDITFVENLRTRVDHELRSILGIGCKIRFLNAGTLPRSEGKAVRVEDTRKL